VRHELERAGIAVFERGWLSSNNVLVRGDTHHGASLFDTGYWRHAAQTVALTRDALGGEPLERVINTHLHSDHCGGNAAVQRSFRCGIDVPAGEAGAVDAWDETRLTYKATGQHCPRFTRTGVIQAGAEIVAGRWLWRVLPSPGHDPLSLAFYQPDLQLLVSADALWEDGFGVVFPELEGEGAFDDVAATLDVFAALPVKLVVPGHGAPFVDMHAAIARARSRLQRFVSDPRAHAMHAAKVLLKFRLLETQSEPWRAILAWAESAQYFELLRQRYFAGQSLDSWVRDLLADLARRGAVRLDETGVRNAD
jgi:glyoxylase-like metal-dependent hydrolase (beta-lactamase superfamily II)